MKTKSLLKALSALVLAYGLTACSATPEIEPHAQEPSWPTSEEEMAHTMTNQISDPWQGFNRRMYYFNHTVDENILLPLVSGYKAITPDPVEQGVSNFFSNLGEIPIFLNAALQLKPKPAFETLGRFAVNTTIGLAGLFDPATHMGLDKQNEDFGQTLGHYGVSPGPYLVLPFLGPSNLRDAFGGIVDMAAYNAAVNELGLKDSEELFMNFVKALDTRKNINFRYYASGSAFEYDTIKLLYTKYREIQIER
ncbi:VacJ family lipoprotein [Catenovulum sp. SM1970]|uniref:MlaA family lipoprotein n=1 Tax=Marinifaba aquimaris TaxID=2741323 RepID=UPI001573ACF0|nr:VacJ family lipoprotein [Marinifaba aquimaris]NTS78089.1 VacJ family lipoprotein [Marinifaba aquimaris]